MNEHLDHIPNTNEIQIVLRHEANGRYALRITDPTMDERAKEYRDLTTISEAIALLRSENIEETAALLEPSSEALERFVRLRLGYEFMIRREIFGSFTISGTWDDLDDPGLEFVGFASVHDAVAHATLHPNDF